MGVHLAAHGLPRDERLWMCLQQPSVIDEILCEAFRHVHGCHVAESLVAILRSRLSDFTHPVGGAFGGHRKAHEAEDHHDAAHNTECAIFATGDDDASDLTLDSAAAGGAVLLIECIESLDKTLHEA